MSDETPPPPSPRDVLDKKYAEGCAQLSDLQLARDEIDARMAALRSDLIALRKVGALFPKEK